MYQAKFINPMIQFNEITFDLVLEDDAGLLEQLRIPVRFPGSVTQAELQAHANAIIEQYNAQAEAVPEIYLPNGVELIE